MIVEPIPPQEVEGETEEPAAYRVHLWGTRAGGRWDATSAEHELLGADLCSAYAWAFEHARADNSAFTLYAVVRDARQTVSLLIVGGLDPAPDELDDSHAALRFDLGRHSDLQAALPADSPAHVKPVDPRDVRSIGRPDDYVVTSAGTEAFRIRDADAIDALQWAVRHHFREGFTLSLRDRSARGRLMRLTTRPAHGG